MRTFVRTGQAPLLAVLLTACAPELAGSRAAIVGGGPSGNASVVYTVQTGSTVLCAGAVVGPRDVLTVQRCVTPAGSDTPIPPAAINVGVGASVDAPERTVAVEEVIISTDAGAETLALIRTVEELGLPALSLPSAAPTVGTGVQIIGYGRTDAAMAGNRHEGDAMIEAVDARTFDVSGDAAACGEGDDGGPALGFSGELLGVGGLGSTGDCPPPLNTYATVFEGLAFIDANLAPPLPDAGAPPEVDAGEPTDAGAPVDAAGGGRMPPDDGGCAIGRGATSAPGLLVALGLLGLLAQRRRKNRSPSSASR